MKGMVFDIQKFSLHDGPGIRTTVFLKGCTLRCFWCQNPEGLSPTLELQFTSSFCVGCGRCFSVCPNHVHMMKDGQHIIDREKCTFCGRCVEECPEKALIFTGREMEAHDVVDVVMEDEAYYRTSGGGVTLSGGEPLMQSDFSAEILAECKRRGIHTAVETALNVPWEAVEKILPHTDLIMADIKLVDPDKHSNAAGASNERILANFERLAELCKPVIVRVPVIPTVNDTDEEIKVIAQYVAQFENVEYVEFLQFHRLGEGKYESIGLPVATKDLPQITAKRMKEIARVAAACNVMVKGENYVHKDGREKRRAVRRNV